MKVRRFVVSFVAARPWRSLRALCSGARRTRRPLALNKPASAIAAVSGGYLFAAEDGGVFTYGSAAFYGSEANTSLQGKIVAIATAPGGEGGDGYWLLGSDGGVFTHPTHGSLGYYGNGRNSGHAPFVDMEATPSGKGYWLLAADGFVDVLGDATKFTNDGTDFAHNAPRTRPWRGPPTVVAPGCSVVTAASSPWAPPASAGVSYRRPA